MRAALAAVALLSAAALAQDTARPRPVGTALSDALPSQVDLVVATPDLPALFGAATKAGLGDAEAWRAAFDAQLSAWGAPTGQPERLVAGSHAFLDAAEGEALVASFSLKTPSGASVRPTLLAFRTTRDAKTLRAAFQEVTRGGLWLRWDGTPHDEEIAGRPVVALPSGYGSLYAVLGGGLVAVCDHPVALGLFLRGLADAKPARATDEQLRLTVRHGRDAAAWEGFVRGDRELVQWNDTAPRVVPLPQKSSATQVFAVASGRVEDLPLFPAPPSLPSGASAERDVSWIGLDGGSLTFARAAGTPGIAGAAWRLGWMRALAGGKLALPIPDVDARNLQGPLESAVKSAGRCDGEFLAWTSDGPGRLAGPFGHGPATFLALRTLHDIAHGVAPAAEPATTERAPVGPPRPGAPLPPPKEQRDR